MWTKRQPRLALPVPGTFRLPGRPRELTRECSRPSSPKTEARRFSSQPGHAPHPGC
jgi:hypothetical protein